MIFQTFKFTKNTFILYTFIKKNKIKMEKIQGIKEIEKIEELLNQLSEKIPQLREEIKYYKERFKIEKYEEKRNENDEQLKLKAENILDRTLQLKQRNEFCINTLNEMKEIFNKLENNKITFEKDKIEYNNFNNKLIE